MFNCCFSFNQSLPIQPFNYNFVIILDSHKEEDAKINAQFLNAHFNPKNGDEIWAEYSNSSPVPTTLVQIKYLKHKPAHGWVNPIYTQKIEKIWKTSETAAPTYFFDKLKTKGIIPDDCEFHPYQQPHYLSQYIDYKIRNKAKLKSDFLISMMKQAPTNKRIFILIGENRLKPSKSSLERPGGKELQESATALDTFVKSTNNIVLNLKP